MHDHACAWGRSWVATNSDKQRHARKAGAVHVDFGLRHSYLLATRLVIKDIGPSTWSPENFRHSAFISGSILLSGEFVGLALIHTCESAGQTGKSRKAQFYCQMSLKTRRDNTLAETDSYISRLLTPSCYRGPRRPRTSLLRWLRRTLLPCTDHPWYSPKRFSRSFCSSDNGD
jgi:hypothetical protein